MTTDSGRALLRHTVATVAYRGGKVARFFTVLQRFDDHLASGEALGNTADRLFQGPVADALTHVGQLTMLRRLAEFPVRGENYFKADHRRPRERRPIGAENGVRLIKGLHGVRARRTARRTSHRTLNVARRTLDVLTHQPPRGRP